MCACLHRCPPPTACRGCYQAAKMAREAPTQFGCMQQALCSPRSSLCLGEHRLHGLSCSVSRCCLHSRCLAATDREGSLASGAMEAEEVVLFFLTSRPAPHASAGQRAAFDLPGRSLRRASCSAAPLLCAASALLLQHMNACLCMSSAIKGESRGVALTNLQSSWEASAFALAAACTQQERQRERRTELLLH